MSACPRCEKREKRGELIRITDKILQCTGCGYTVAERRAKPVGVIKEFK